MLEKGGLPLYQQLYQIFKKKIHTNEWQENTYIPAESNLMKQFGVGRETVRRAILTLVREGYLSRRQGMGTFVCRRRPEDGIEPFMSFTAEILTRGYKPGTKVLCFQRRIASNPVRSALGLEEGKCLIYVKRLRFANEVPVAVEESYLNEDVVGDVMEEKLKGSLYNYLVYDKGICPGRMVQEIKSVLADGEMGSLLDVEVGHPILELSRTVCTLDEMAFYYTNFCYRGDIYSIKTKMDLP